MKEFFQKYAEAFDSLDANRIADLYMLPCSASDGDGVNVFSDRKSLIKKFTANCKSLVGMGYKRSKVNILDVIEMDETTNTVVVGWRVILESAELEFRTLYVCHKVNQKWRIFSANVYAGSAAE
jgi:hypothetical protein